MEREWQGDHLTEAGAPLDFTLGTPNLGFVEPWRTLITDALGRGRWVVLLTTMHISFLNGNKRGEDANLDAFLTEIAAQQAQWRKELGINKAEADAAYAFLQWCDRLSLILCQRALPERERWLEISDGPDGERYDVLQREDDTITIKPWPFREARFVVVADARYLTQLRFKHNAELIAALEASAVHTVEWEFVK